MKKMNKIGIIAACMALFALCATPLFAATTDATPAGTGFGVAGESGVFTIQQTLDLSATSVASNDTVQVLDIPAGTVVLGVVVDIETATASATTIDAGDNAGAALYVSNKSSTNLVETAAAATTVAKYYVSADTIDLHFDGAPGATGVIRTKAVVVPIRSDN